MERRRATDSEAAETPSAAESSPFSRLRRIAVRATTRVADELEDTAMTRYAILTHEPSRLRRTYGSSVGWLETAFRSAVEALTWERRLRNEGVVVLESRGWHFGVVFTHDDASESETSSLARR